MTSSFSLINDVAFFTPTIDGRLRFLATIAIWLEIEPVAEIKPLGFVF